jgi:leukotriene-A4 hydrolase
VTSNVAEIVLQVRCAWLLLCINAEDEAALPDALTFAAEQGRMKYVRPLYKALFKSKMGKQAAVQQFERKSAMYHPIARKMVAHDLQLH